MREIIRSENGLIAFKSGETTGPDVAQAIEFERMVTNSKKDNQAIRLAFEEFELLSDN